MSELVTGGSELQVAPASHEWLRRNFGSITVSVGALSGAVLMPRARVPLDFGWLWSDGQEGLPPCSLSAAREAAGKLGTAKMYLGSGQTCPGVRLNVNTVNLSGKGKGRLGFTPPAHTKTNVIFQVRAHILKAEELLKHRSRWKEALAASALPALTP